MNLRHLKTLVAIADCGSFQGAAARLGITQSAVSMQMKSLEQDLQLGLFDRKQRPPRLSGTGRTLLAEAREIVRRIERLEGQASDTRLLSGTLRLGVVPSASVGLLPDALANLAASHPEVRTRIVSGLTDDLLKQVERGALEAAIVTARGAEREKAFSYQEIFSEPLVAVAPSGLPVKDTKDLLSRHPFIRFNRRTGVGQIVSDGLAAAEIAVADVMELDSLEAILQMVVRGLGVSVVPRRSITPAFEERIQSLPFGEPPLTRQIALVSRTEDAPSPLAAALLAELRRVAAP